MSIGPNGEKHPADVIGNAVHCCKVLVGEAEESYTGKQRNGGLKGGRARAASMTPERRSEIAKAAAKARWNDDPRV